MKLKPETVKKAVMGWNIMFPGKRTDPELAFLCGKMMQHCSSAYSDEQFRAAAHIVEKESSFFPTPKDLLAVTDRVYRDESHYLQANQNIKRLAEETGDLTDEEVARNLEKIEVIKAMVAGKMTMEEAVARQESLSTYAKR